MCNALEWEVLYYNIFKQIENTERRFAHAQAHTDLQSFIFHLCDHKAAVQIKKRPDQTFHIIIGTEK